MIKELTKFEEHKTKSDVVYYKLYFGNQWFLVTPWHYNVAKLNDNFNFISGINTSCVGKQYDIAWRSASINGSSVTFLTKIEEVKIEFEWLEEEQGIASNSVPQAVQAAPSDFDPFSDPFAGSEEDPF